MRKFAVMLLAGLIAAGCGSGGGREAKPTMAEAISVVTRADVSIIQTRPLDEQNEIVLFRTETQPNIYVKLVERTAFGKWRVTDGVSYSDLTPVGPLTYHRENEGHVEEKVGDITIVSAKVNVIYGEVLDPAITWVEVTLKLPDAQPQRVDVVGGTWMVLVPPYEGLTHFALRAGSEDGELFSDEQPFR